MFLKKYVEFGITYFKGASILNFRGRVYEAIKKERF